MGPLFHVFVTGYYKEMFKMIYIRKKRQTRTNVENKKSWTVIECHNYITTCEVKTLDPENISGVFVS